MGITPIKNKIDQNVANALMLVTALNPIIGYDNAGKIAKKALDEDISLEQAAVDLNLLTSEEFQKHIQKAFKI